MTDLERALTDLGHHLDVPAAPDLPFAVATALHADGGRRPARSRRRLAIAFAAVVAALAGATAVPAVAGWLGVPGIVVKQVQGPVPVPPVTPAPLALGRPMTLDGASAEVGFTVLLPARMGAPDETFVADVAGTPVVSLVYRPRPGLPATGTTGVGALLSELRAPVDEEATLAKNVGPDTVVETVTVAGERGLWIEGIHDVRYAMPDGDIGVDSLRLADRVLLWQRGDVTLRLETALDRDSAVRLAETVG